MARNMVTRTVRGTQVTVKVVDAASEQIVQETIVLGRDYTTKDEAGNITIEDEAKLKKAVVKAIPDGKILVAIVSATPINKCYGVPTAKFMELATELDPETRRAVEAEEAADAE
jgi:hypothetical protein